MINGGYAHLPSAVKPRIQQQQGVYLLDITARECHF
jgi:hypothetical protein